jgi:hypothetical protein
MLDEPTVYTKLKLKENYLFFTAIEHDPDRYPVAEPQPIHKCFRSASAKKPKRTRLLLIFKFTKAIFQVGPA